MRLFSRLGTLSQRILIVLAVMVATTAGLGFRIVNTRPVYEAQVKLQLTAPQEENVQLFESYRAGSRREEMTVARNNFIEVLNSREVYNRTIKQFGVENVDEAYVLNVEPVRDSDFLYVSVLASRPKLAEQIANTHAATAIAYYGEVRAKPATATKDFLDEQLRSAQQQLRDAEQALTDFKVENGVAVLSDELLTAQQQISDLELERDRASTQGETNGATTLSTVAYDRLIKERRDEANRLAELEPQYNQLQENVTQAREEYALLQEKYAEAVLKENTVKNAGFIQMIEPAIAPDAPAPTRLKTLLVLAIVASLGLGITSVLLLEYIASRQNTTRRFNTTPAMSASE